MTFFIKEIPTSVDSKCNEEVGSSKPKEKDMSDSISQLGKIPMPATVISEKPNQVIDQARSEGASSSKPTADNFVLSANAEQALSTAEFDTAMVARVKAAISEGNYPVNEQAVAEKFYALESMINGE